MLADTDMWNSYQFAHIYPEFKLGNETLNGKFRQRPLRQTKLNVPVYDIIVLYGFIPIIFDDRVKGMNNFKTNLITR